MTDGKDVWQALCTKLASDEYDLAFQLLEQVLETTKTTHAHTQFSPQSSVITSHTSSVISGAAAQLSAQIHLWTAHLHMLSGEVAVETVGQHLQNALSLYPKCAQEPLWLALQFEMQSQQNRSNPQLPKPPVPSLLLTSIPLTDNSFMPFEPSWALVQFHLMCGLVSQDKYHDALEITLNTENLPVYLQWRWYACKAEICDELNDAEQAEQLYGKAAHVATELHKAFMYQEQANVLIQLGKYAKARWLLDQAKLYYQGKHPDEKMYRASWHCLYAQLLLQIGQFAAAYEDIQAARLLERELKKPSYNVALITGQILSYLQRHNNAITYFNEALTLANENEKLYIHHEVGVIFLEQDRPLEAKEQLSNISSYSHYPYYAEVLVDLAECEYRLELFDEASKLAKEAIQQGAIVSASIVLGNIALFYYRLDEGLEHFQRVTLEASPNSYEWVMAHQMAADIMAKQGFPDPVAAYSHAKQALEHITQDDDWYVIIKEHAEQASQLIDKKPRTLN